MRLRIPERGERGAIAIMTAVLMSVLLAVAALAVDITTQVNVRQKLFDTVDASAQAGAYRLPSPGPTAASDALASFRANNGPAATPPVVPTVGLFCVVASKLVGGIYIVDNSQIPATCYPLDARRGSSPNWTWAGSRCNSKICGIPCSGAVGTNDVCNTIKVTGEKTVPFSFAPAIGITAPGRTGSVSSAACKGVCGTVPINPMDIAVVADRTTSMDSDISKLIAGLVGPPTGTPGPMGMFQVMTPSQQYVALGTIGRSKLGAASTCPSQPWNDSYPALKGPWMPVPFSTDYLLTGTTTINTSSTLVRGVNCLTNTSSTGTYLASPMKAAARYLLGIDPNNLPVPETRTGTIRKAIIFETDGAPNESTITGSTALDISGDIGSSTGATACNNFTDVATKAKAIPNNILVVTVAFNVSTTKCSSVSGSAKLADVLAAAASPAASGPTPGNSTAGNYNNFDCSATNGRTFENGDGDYFFCAASGTDMALIYRTIFTQIANGIRLIQLPPGL